MYKFLRAVILFAAIFFLGISEALDAKALPLPVGNIDEVSQVNSHIQFYRDPRNIGLIPPATHQFENLAQAVMLGYSEDDFWFYLALLNDQAAVLDLVSFFDNRMVAEVQLYRKSAQGQWLALDSRRSTPFPAFDIQLQPEEEVQLMYKVRFTHQIKINFYLASKDKFAAMEKSVFSSPMAFMGLAVGFILYSVMILFLVREASYALFLAFVLPTSVCVFALNGFFYPTFGIDVPPYLLTAAANLAIIGGTWFSNVMLKVAYYYPTLYLAQRFIQFASGSLIFCLFLGFSRPTVGYITDTIIFIGISLAFFTSIKSAKTFPKVAISYLVSWSLLLLGVSTWFANWYGLIGDSFLTFNAINIGFNGQLIFLVIGISEKINLLKKESEKEKLARSMIKKHMEDARLMQEALLHQPPSIPGVEIATFYQAANNAGGDWYSFYYEVECNYLFVLVGDVTGHGIQSALITGAASGASHAYFSQRKRQVIARKAVKASLEDLALAINEAVFQTGQSSNNLMTMALIGIDLNTMSAFYINAGHTPIFHRYENRVRGLIHGGTPLGLRQSPSFNIQEFAIHDNDLILLHTDGLIENQKSQRQAAVYRRFKAQLAASDSLNYIKDSLIQSMVRSSKSDRNDDVTFVLLRFHRAVEEWKKHA